MQRPQSEGRISSPPRRQRHTNRHRKMSVLSKSCVVFSESSPPSGGNRNHHVDGADPHHASLGELRVKDGDFDRPPRRPKSTPKPRVEQLLIGPRKTHIQEAHSSSGSGASSSSTLFFMTHLPDSPPRPNHKSTTQIAHLVSTSDGENNGDDDDNCEKNKTHDTKRLNQLSQDQREAKAQQAVAAASKASPDKDEEDQAREATHQQQPSLSLPDIPEPSQAGSNHSMPSLETSSSHTDNEEESGNESDTEAHSDYSDPAAVVVAEEGEEAGNCESDLVELRGPKIDGPLQIDLFLSSPVGKLDATVADSPAHPQLGTSDEEEDDATEEGESADARVSARDPEELLQMKASETGDQHREQLRGELESYVALLTSRKGEDGAQLVEFPRNYQQVLSLMSERDVRDEDSASSSSSSSGSNANGGQRSWSHVLIQAGLSKQQAFGALNDEDEASGGEGGMAAKIALKMARVRQLDAVLEEKLGKNLYASSSSVATTNSTKQVAKKSNSNNQQSVSNGEDPMTPLSIASTSGGGGGGASSKGGGDFIERNRKVIAHGMKAVLSKDEESRLSRLPRDLGGDNATETPGFATGATGDTQPALPAPGAISTAPLGRNEFEMDANDKKQIEEVLAEKRGVYQSSLLPPHECNEFGDDDDHRDGNELLPSSTSTNASKSKSAFNITQAAKEERLRKQRLERIEQEIQFLKENECMSIVADDGDANSAFNDDTFSDIASTVDGTTTTASERSSRTTASSVANSMCSTRSGVISHRQFNQFLALEKQEFKPETKASADEIRRLVASLSHLRTTTPTTSRPVA